MRLPSASRIRTWVLARMERLWSRLAPGRQTGGDRGRRRGRGSVPTRTGARERGAPPPDQRVAAWLPAPQTRCRRSAEADPRRAVVAIVAAGDRPGPARDRSALASRPVPAVLAAPIPAAQDVAAAARDDRPDPRHGGAGPAVGCRAHPRRAAQARDQGQQADDPEVYARRSGQTRWRPELGDLREEPRRTDVGLRLHPDP